MAKKLTSFLKTKVEWRLSLEALAAGLLLIVAASPIRPIGFIGLVGFIAFLFRVYFWHLPQIRDFRFSFWLLPALALLAAGLIRPIGPIGPISIAGLIFIGFFFLVLGFSNFLFKNNQAVYGFFQTGLLFFLFLIFFNQIGSIGLVGPVGLIVVIFFLFREFFLNPISQINPVGSVGPVKPKRILLVSAIFGLIALELAWLVSFLPLGFINAAVFSTLFIVLGRDIIQNHFRGVLGRSFVFRQITFFIVIAILVFASSQWRL